MTQSELDEVLRAHRLWLSEGVGAAANLAGADLGGRRLAWEDMTGVNFTNADLSAAILYTTNLTRADLTDANLHSANLYGADLTGVNLTRAVGLPVIQPVAGFRASLLAAVTADGCSLKMTTWHTCETTHCLAGWVVTLHPEGELLESVYWTGTAASLILNACGENVPDFYDTEYGAESRALNWLRTGNQTDTHEGDQC